MTIYAAGDVVERDGELIICINSAEQTFIAYDLWLANEVNAVVAQAGAALDEMGEPPKSPVRMRGLAAIATFVEAKLRQGLADQVEAFGAVKH